MDERFNYGTCTAIVNRMTKEELMEAETFNTSIPVIV